MIKRRRRNAARPSIRSTTRSRRSLRNRKVQNCRTRRPTVGHARLRSRKSRRHRPHAQRRSNTRWPRRAGHSVLGQHRPLRRRNVRLRSQRSCCRQIGPSAKHDNIIRQICGRRDPGTSIGHAHGARRASRPLRPRRSRRSGNTRLRQHRPERRTHIRLSAHIRRQRHITRSSESRHAPHTIRSANQPRPLKARRGLLRPRRAHSSSRTRDTRRPGRPRSTSRPRRPLRRQQRPLRRTLIRSVPHISRNQRNIRGAIEAHRIMQRVVRRRRIVPRIVRHRRALRPHRSHRPLCPRSTRQTCRSGRSL